MSHKVFPKPRKSTQLVNELIACQTRNKKYILLKSLKSKSKYNLFVHPFMRVHEFYQLGSKTTFPIFTSHHGEVAGASSFSGFQQPAVGPPDAITHVNKVHMGCDLTVAHTCKLIYSLVQRKVMQNQWSIRWSRATEVYILSCV